MEKFTSSIQYIAKSHSNKDEAKLNKQNVKKDKSVYVGDKTFEQIVKIHNQGKTIARVGKLTRFGVFDIDESELSIDEIKTCLCMWQRDFKVCYSASRNPYKFHIFFDFQEDIHVDSFADAMKQVWGEVELILKMNNLQGSIKLDKAADDFYHCYFGPYALEANNEPEFANDRQCHNWVKIGERPQFVAVKQEKIRYIPLTTAEYCKSKGINVLDIPASQKMELNRDIPWNSYQAFVYKKGTRFNMCRSDAYFFAARASYLNKMFNEGYNDLDVIKFTSLALSKSVEDSNDFKKDIQLLSDFAGSAFRDYEKMTLEELLDNQKAWCKECKRDGYKNREYMRSLMNMVAVDSYDGTQVTFKTRKDMLLILESLPTPVTEQSFDNYVIQVYGKPIHFQEVSEYKKHNKHNKSDKQKQKEDAENQYLKDYYLKNGKLPKLTDYTKLKNRGINVKDWRC